MPCWIIAFAAGMLVGWFSFAIHDAILWDTSVNIEAVSTTSTFQTERVHTHGSGHHSSSNNANVLPKYYADNKFDLQSWEYFDNTAVYDDQNLNMVFWRTSSKQRSLEIQEALNDAVRITSQQLGKTLKLDRLINGYVRYNPTRGYEYIIDAHYIQTCSKCSKKPITRRISFVRAPSEAVPVYDKEGSNEIVNIIIPISNVNERLQEFMEKFENVFLKGKDYVHLVLVVYQENIQTVESTAEHYRSKYKSARITILKGEGTFSRAKALDYGMSTLKDNDLAFFCDVDITVERSFTGRCRRNTIRGQRVFYPVVFKLYNSQYAYPHGPKPTRTHINRQNGHWFYYSYGMLCMYKSDYVAVGGLDTKITGWGLEDVLFFKAVLKSKLEVFRSPDPALTHRWHSSSCPDTLSAEQHSDCLGSLYEGVADKKELAQYIYEHGYQIKESTSR